VVSIYKKVDGQGKDLVLLHGWSQNHKSMQPIMNFLKNNYHVTSFDLPGAGESDWHPEIQTIHDMADQLLNDLPENAIYIGWSFGGLIGISIAASYPNRVSHFIGIGTTPKFVADSNWPGVPQPGFQVVVEQEVNAKGLKNFLREYYNSEFAAFDPKPENYFNLLDSLDDADKFDMDIYSKAIKICDATDLRKEFKSLKCPVDLIFGDLDEAVPVTQHECIKKLNPAVKIHVIPGAHHIPFWTHPKQFNELLQQIL
jgi:pimeloyl-[acyl-carrier protein] methyl ester esterase